MLVRQQNLGKGAALRAGDPTRRRRGHRHPGRRHGVRPSRRAGTGRPDPARGGGRRLRLAALRWQATTRLHVLAPGRKPIPQPADQRVLYNTTLSRHGDRLQGVPKRRAAQPRPSTETTSRSSRRSPPRSASVVSASTSCRSPITAAPTRKARRSPGGTASKQFGFSSASASAADVHRSFVWLGLLLSLAFGYLAFRNANLGELTRLAAGRELPVSACRRVSR